MLPTLDNTRFSVIQDQDWPISRVVVRLISVNDQIDPSDRWTWIKKIIAVLQESGPLRFDIFITFWSSFLCSLYRVFQQDQIPPYRILSQGVSRAASQPHTSHKLISSDRSCRAISENRRSKLRARRRWRAARADSVGQCVSCGGENAPRLPYTHPRVSRSGKAGRRSRGGRTGLVCVVQIS